MNNLQRYEDDCAQAYYTQEQVAAASRNLPAPGANETIRVTYEISRKTTAPVSRDNEQWQGNSTNWGAVLALLVILGIIAIIVMLAEKIADIGIRLVDAGPFAIIATAAILGGTFYLAIQLLNLIKGSKSA